MTCPYCSKEMKPGTIDFDGRSHIRWHADDEAKTKSDRFWDVLGGVGNITAAKYGTFARGTIPSNYCPACKIMIFETDITK